MRPRVRSYALAFGLSLLGSLSLGVLALFSIFTQPLQSRLRYPQSTINSIIIAQNLGLNGFTPLCGLIADLKGPWILSLLALVCYLLGFSAVLFIYQNEVLDPIPVYISFFLIGCAHTCLLFSCLLNCARSLGKYYTTLAVGTPNLMIAFSTFLEIHVLRNWFDESDPTEAFQQKLRFFMVTLCASSVFAFLGCKITDRTEKNEHEIEHFSSFNASPLLSGGSAVLGSSSPKAAIPTDDLEYVQLADQMSASSVTYQQQITRFLTDPLMYPLNAAFFMAVGATEFFLTNLSSILSSLGQDTLDYDLQLYSVTSTVIRFVIMVATDHVCATYRISRLSILAGLIVMCGLGHVYLSSWPIPGLHVNVVVMLNALLNSGIYTLFPAVLAAVYGFEVLGTTYGIFSCCSIIGNMLLNLVYGADYTRNCVDSANNNLVICSTYTFLLSGVALTVLGSLIYSLKNRYLARADEDF